MHLKSFGGIGAGLVPDGYELANVSTVLGGGPLVVELNADDSGDAPTAPNLVISNPENLNPGAKAISTAAALRALKALDPDIDPSLAGIAFSVLGVDGWEGIESPREKQPGLARAEGDMYINLGLWQLYQENNFFQLAELAEGLHNNEPNNIIYISALVTALRNLGRPEEAHNLDKAFYKQHGMEIPQFSARLIGLNFVFN